MTFWNCKASFAFREEQIAGYTIHILLATNTVVSPLKPILFKISAFF